MKNTAQKQKEKEQQEAKGRRESKAPRKWGSTGKTHTELLADLERRRQIPSPSLADLQELSYKSQSASMGKAALKAFAENNDEKGRYFAGQSFNLALHALGRHSDYYPWLLVKYEKVHAFKTINQG